MAFRCVHIPFTAAQMMLQTSLHKKEVTMKAMLSLGILVCCLSLFAQIAAAPEFGSGSPANPYQLSTFNNLVWLMQTPSMWSLHYIQTDNIDASASTQLDSGAGWTPIGNGATMFTGSFDGCGYEILGLSLSRASTYYTGMFGYANAATLSRIHLRNINMRGFIYAGGLVGVLTSGKMNNCSATGSIIGNTVVGGLLGYANHNTVITNCYAQVSVQGSEHVGGLAGQNGFNNAYYYHCYSSGAVYGGTTYNQGGFIGNSGGGTAKYCFWDTQSSGQASSPLGTPKTTTQMKQQSTYETWNFSTQWSIAEGVSYPNLSLLAGWETPDIVSIGALSGSGTQSDPYQIYNAAQLNAIRLAPAAWYKLFSDIDLSSSVVWNHGQGWLPIGSSSTPFTGHLDGNGYKLINLSINLPQTDYVAMFANTQNATFMNLHLQNARVMGKNFSGTLIADGYGGTIRNIRVSCQLIAANNSGGLCGRLTNSLVNGCMADVNIPNAGDKVGALLGSLGSSGSITGTLSQSYSLGSINAGWNLGGLVGYLNWGYINDCYSLAYVSGGRMIGGVVGVVGGSNPGHVSCCYGAGEITLGSGGSFAGGVIGFLYDNSTVSNSYWDIDSTGIPNDIQNRGRTHAQMIYPGSQSTFAAWDFANVWRHDTNGSVNSGYPYLAWQEQSLPDAVQNLSISQSDAIITLSWQPVAGVSHYCIYASDSPNVNFENWTYIGQSNTNSFSTEALGTMRFFVVRSVVD